MSEKCALQTTQIFICTVILGIIASISHFAYQLSGENVIVGIFNPVNESVWEHLKFMFFPQLIFWTASYFIIRKECRVSLYTWITAATSSLVAAPLLVILLFYAYTGALGIESVVVDILLVFICYFLALNTANHLLKYSDPGKAAAVISVIIVAAIFAAFVVFTFNPPHIPLFYDSVTGTYGICQTS
ncbi:MAG: DUF6512 family protein [Eubacteriales bacterium]